ncbi:hypothetical protein AB0J83_05110 [Actinoplanes sp. NPDC049596]|uniref:hypothetical protein n=1 Tax=unclassified Actinoplanes TaxID=2626549 RepID=UPI00341390B3
MGSSYQTILAAGARADVEAAVAASARRAAVLPVGESRWAIIPRADGPYAETEPIAALVSRTGAAASFDVFDSTVLALRVYRDGGVVHAYLSRQEFVEPMWDDNDDEYWVDLLGREYRDGERPPAGPLGGDAGAVADLGIAPVDREALERLMREPTFRAGQLHHDILRALNVEPGPLTMTYGEARKRRWFGR